LENFVIDRQLGKTLQGKLNDGKAIILTGARQTGKTTLLQTLFGGQPETLWLSGDEPDVRGLFENLSSTRLKAILGGKSSATPIHERLSGKRVFSGSSGQF
jgi:predicted AAA+ superfamily ATPase